MPRPVATVAMTVATRRSSGATPSVRAPPAQTPARTLFSRSPRSGGRGRGGAGAAALNPGPTMRPPGRAGRPRGRRSGWRGRAGSRSCSRAARAREPAVDRAPIAAVVVAAAAVQDLVGAEADARIDVEAAVVAAAQQAAALVVDVGAAGLVSER